MVSAKKLWRSFIKGERRGLQSWTDSQPIALQFMAQLSAARRGTCYGWYWASRGMSSKFASHVMISSGGLLKEHGRQCVWWHTGGTAWWSASEADRYPRCFVTVLKRCQLGRMPPMSLGLGRQNQTPKKDQKKKEEKIFKRSKLTKTKESHPSRGEEGGWVGGRMGGEQTQLPN